MNNASARAELPSDEKIAEELDRVRFAEIEANYEKIRAQLTVSSKAEWEVLRDFKAEMAKLLNAAGTELEDLLAAARRLENK